MPVFWHAYKRTEVVVPPRSKKRYALSVKSSSRKQRWGISLARHVDIISTRAASRPGSYPKQVNCALYAELRSTRYSHLIVLLELLCKTTLTNQISSKAFSNKIIPHSRNKIDCFILVNHHIITGASTATTLAIITKLEMIFRTFNFQLVIQDLLNLVSFDWNYCVI